MAPTMSRLTLPDEHHAGDVEGLGVGDAQAVAELGLLAEPGHEVADLRAAAVHDHGPEPDRAHAARCPRRTTRPGAGSTMALPPYFTTTVAAAEALDVRQRLDEDARPASVGARARGPLTTCPMFSST